MDRDAGARDMTASVHSKCPANRDDPPNRATVMILGRRTLAFHALGPDVFAQLCYCYWP